MEQITTVNPASNKPLKNYPVMQAKEIERTLDLAQKSFTASLSLSVAKRVDGLNRIAQKLRAQKRDLGVLITREMGKPITQSYLEIEKCALACEYYATHAEDYLRSQDVKTDFLKSYSCLVPQGVVLAVMPWNFPFWQIVRVLAPQILVGNTVLLKHASNTTGSALALEKLVHEAVEELEIAAKFLFVVVVPGGGVLPLISDRRITGVTLTGSAPAGRAVAKAAGENLKKSVLELGGSDAYVVLKDADLEKAAEVCVDSRLINSGQSCIAAKRFIIEKSVHNDFVDLFAAQLAQRIVGDPENEKTQVGPLARTDLLHDLQKQISQSVGRGAKVLATEFQLPSGGNYFAPRVLTHVQPEHAVFAEETFGPVAAIVTAENENHAIELANHSAFGLGGAVFTRDVEKGELIARKKLRAGSAFVNSLVRSDPRLPFGGIGESGYGRELGAFGVMEFANVKTVAVAP